MATVRLKLRYPELSALIQEQINQQKLEFRSYPIKVDKLKIEKNMDQLIISSDIISKWNAGFRLSSSPRFVEEESRLEIKNLDIKFETKNIIFKGLLKIAKNTVLSRIEKIAETPITKQIEILKELLDGQLSRTEIPHGLNLKAETKEIYVKQLCFNKDHVFVVADVEQILSISFKE